jgi:hypothetical protein
MSANEVGPNEVGPNEVGANEVGPNEIEVRRKPIEGKYYEATFWTRKTGHWSNEKYYTDKTVHREYVGQYLRHRQEGYGDGADHWAIFLRDNKEIEIEYDYDGKRAFCEVFVI